MRTEKDFLGHLDIPVDALYGIHSVRAAQNFSNDTRFHIEWYKAVGLVKLSYFRLYKKFKAAIESKYNLSEANIPLQLLDDTIIKALEEAATEVSRGDYFNSFIVPAIQGGAGTSINMNINEIITNVALIKTGNQAGDYNVIDPVEHANIFQSTNDVIPSSLKVALMQLLNRLEENINQTRQQVERLETRYRNALRTGYTQLQEAVPSTWGKLFSNYSDALSRDWWRVSKCKERIKEINLGGSAIGTCINVPRFFVMNIDDELRAITQLPLAKSENLTDTTSNQDSIVEMHATIKAHAVNLEKISSDIRLLSSGINRQREVEIPSRQAGSSIMPGKVNPVIPEHVISCAHTVYANDVLISSLAAQGNLELNAYIPTIGHAAIESIKLLISSNQALSKYMFPDLKVNEELAYQRLLSSPSLTTALIPLIGYNKASLLAQEMKKANITITEANKQLNLLDEKKLETLIRYDNLLKAGYTIDELLEKP